jgi:hypothetical protein
MVRWALFLVLVATVMLLYLMIDFKGLSHAKGIDQAQIARELARGKDFNTKCIRPVSLYQINEHLRNQAPEGEAVGTANLQLLTDTYHAPLNPLLNSLLLRCFKAKWDFDGKKTQVYFLDYVIVGASMFLLLGAVGVTYLLVSRIFDTKIAGVTALMMVMCQLLWRFAQSGLPQPLMMFLFAFACYFLYKAVENVQAGKGAYLWCVLSGLFFGMLALAHWITIWLFVGALIFTAVFMRPRGILAVVMFGVFGVIVLPWAYVNFKNCGNPMGSGLYQFFAGLAGGSESMVMRNLNPDAEPFNPDGIWRKISLGTIAQLGTLFSSLGGIIAAPLFFIALLHPFKRPEIAFFRWAILLMWIFGSMGMAVFGVTSAENDPNQLNVLLIGPMAAYGLAVLSVLWARLNLPAEQAIIRNGHLILCALLSASPMLLTLPWNIISGMRGMKANWPPYLPSAYTAIKEGTDPQEIIVSDMPWAVAWYADRTSVWLPRTREQFMKLVANAKDQGTPIVGVLITPESTFAPYQKDIGGERGEWREWAALIERYSMLVTYRADSMSADGPMADFPFKYPNPLGLNGAMVWYTDKKRVN